MQRIEQCRSVLADPSSVALVLAGPAARELWPARRLASVGGTPPLAVAVAAPQRSGRGFVARVAVTGSSGTLATGRLSIERGRAGGCDVRLSLAGPDDLAGVLARDAGRYLEALAQLTQARSSAA